MIKNRFIQGKIETGQIDTYVVMDGNEMDVTVDYRICPAEPDVNFDGGIEVESAWYEDQGCILDELSDQEYDQLVIRVQDEVAGYGDPRADYGDWLHDCRRDERLTG